MVKKVKEGWRILSKTGNLGTFPTKAAATKRLRKIEFFKRTKGKS